MKKNVKKILTPLVTSIVIILCWYFIANSGRVAAYVLPSPVDVASSLIEKKELIFSHLLVTLEEALLGLALAIIIAVALAVLMDRFEMLYNAVYPILLLSQMVPVVAIAPLFVLWLGFGIAPKILVVISCCYFPIAINLVASLRATDGEMERLMTSMSAKPWQRLLYFKLPAAAPDFFTGLRLAATYSIMGAVVAEWLGGSKGLGVYMMRVKNSFAIDEMFAAIIVVVLLSLALFFAVSLVERLSLRWQVAYKNKYEKD